MATMLTINGEQKSFDASADMPRRDQRGAGRDLGNQPAQDVAELRKQASQ